MKKTITVREFADELMLRINKNRDIDCCREEIKNLAGLAKAEIGDKLLEVNWKD